MPDENYSHDLERAEIDAGLRKPEDAGIPLEELRSINTEGIQPEGSGEFGVYDTDGSGPYYENEISTGKWRELTRFRDGTPEYRALERKSKRALIVGGALCVVALGLNIANHLWFNPTKHYESKVMDSMFFVRAKGLFGYEALTKNFVFEGETVNAVQVSSGLFGTKFGVNRYYYDYTDRITSIEKFVYDGNAKRLVFDKNSKVLTPYNDVKHRREFDAANEKLNELRRAYSEHMKKHHHRN